MAVDFLKAKKRQRYLLLALAVAICAILVVVWQGFLKEAAPLPTPAAPAITQPDIKINWNVLEDIKLEALKVFEEVLPFEGETGRENPFEPY